jgi:CRP-like cAMP-binding protein
MLLNLLVSLKFQKLYKEKVVVEEDKPSNYFYLIKSGEFEMTKKLIKPTSNRDSKEAFIDDEMVRVKDLTHNIQRNTDEVLD